MVIEINLDNSNLIKGTLLDREEVISSLNKNPFGKYLIYIESDTITGYLYYNDIYDRIEINQIEVLDNYKRKGYASKMMEYLLKQNKSITLEVKENNIPAINLYKKYGFKQVAIRKGYYDGIDGILMSLEMKW